jgi:epoxide hydrolase
MEDLTPDEQAALDVLLWFWENKGAFNTLHGQRPQTVAHAISDSPAGLRAWNGQLFDDTLDDDFVLTNAALYWLTCTAGSSTASTTTTPARHVRLGRRQSLSRWPPQPTAT